MDFYLLKRVLDTLIRSQVYLSEQCKYQILLNRLNYPSTYKLAQSYIYDVHPYTSALQHWMQNMGSLAK